MAAEDIIGVIIVLAILLLIVSLTVAVTVLALNARKLIDENVRLRGEVERLKQSPKDQRGYDIPLEYEMPRPLYERPQQGFEQRG